MKLDIEYFVHKFSDTSFVQNPVLNVIKLKHINNWLNIIWVYKR